MWVELSPIKESNRGNVCWFSFQTGWWEFQRPENMDVFPQIIKKKKLGNTHVDLRLDGTNHTCLSYIDLIILFVTMWTERLCTHSACRQRFHWILWIPCQFSRRLLLHLLKNIYFCFHFISLSSLVLYHCVTQISCAILLVCCSLLTHCNECMI